ncbi:MAG: TolC family protein [Gemmatimonadetes bacterium]|nr:TolC family protein [Gemmatimonadota bacterium]
MRRVAPNRIDARTMNARSFLLFLSLVATPAVAQQADTTVARTLAPAAERVALPDALARALHVQPAMVQANGAIRNASAQQRSAYGAFLPSLNATGSGSKSFTGTKSHVENGQVVTSNSSVGLNMGLSASIDLWTGLRRGADIAAANAADQSADAGLVNARFQVTLQTTQAYLDALAGRQTVEVRVASVRRAMEQLKVSVAKLRAGSATRSDSLRSEVNLGNARIALINAEIQQATAEATLGRLVGSAGRVEAVDDSSYYAPQPIDTTGLRAEARERAPQILSADASLAAARAQVRSAYSAYSPTLSLSGSLSKNGNAALLDSLSLYNSRQLSLSMNWPIFNRFTRERNVVTQQVAADNAAAAATDAQRAVDAGITQQLIQLAAAQARIGITQSSVQAAREDIRVIGERYRLGAATIVDLLTSQEALTQAEVDAVNARFDYLRAKAQVEALIGRSL